jgi:GH24 family phage-related lysozyme (muramidase)
MLSVELVQDPVSAVVPVVYNITQNQTSLASLQKELNNPTLHAVQQHLNRWNSTTLPVPGRPCWPFYSSTSILEDRT